MSSDHNLEKHKDSLEQFPCPTHLKENWVQYIKLFRPAVIKYEYCINELSLAQHLNLPLANNKYNWQSLIDFLECENFNYYSIKVIRKDLYNEIFINISDYFYINCKEKDLTNKDRLIFPEMIFTHHQHGTSFATGETIKHESTFIPYKEFIEHPEEFTASGLKRFNDLYKPLIHSTSNAAAEIYLDTYKNSELNAERHRKDCEIIVSTIDAIFLSTNYFKFLFIYPDRINAALFADMVLTSDNPIKHIRTINKDNLESEIDTNYWYRTIYHFITLCIGDLTDLPESLHKYGGRLIGTKITRNKSGNTAKKYIGNKGRSSSTVSTVIRKKYSSVVFPNPFKTLVINSHSESNQTTSDKQKGETLSKKPIEHKKPYLNSVENTSYSRHIPANKDIPSKSKITHISISLLFNYLSYAKEFDDLEYAYNWLCTFTGISWKCLENMEVCNDISNIEINTVKLNLETSVIHYTCKNSATDLRDVQKQENHSIDIVKLSIPKLISKILTKDNTTFPLNGIASKCLYRAKYYRYKHGGTSPTPRKLNSTFKNIISGFGLNSLETDIISGSTDFKNSAKIKYAKFDLNILNTKYQDCLNSFINFSKNELDINASKHQHLYHKIDKLGTFGSLIAFPIKEFEQIITDIARNYNILKSRNLKHSEDRIKEIQYKYIYLYLMEELGLGLRPFGKETFINPILDNKYWLVKQKNSSNFIETSILPVPELLKEQLLSCRDHVYLLIDYFKKRKYQIQISADIVNPIPLKIELNSTSKIIKFSRLNGSDFKSFITENNLLTKLPGNIYVNNMFRHSLYTYSLAYLSDSLLSHLFQHHLSNQDSYADFSTFDNSELDNLRVFLNNTMKKIGFKLLK